MYKNNSTENISFAHFIIIIAEKYDDDSDIPHTNGTNSSKFD